jgi:hypothetical protein
MNELVSIAAVPNQSLEYMKGLQSFYSRILIDAVPEHGQIKKPGRQSVPWKDASKIMWSAMKTKKRLECGR